MYWYELILKKGDPILLTPIEAKRLCDLLISDNVPTHVSVKGQPVAPANIYTVQETNRRITSAEEQNLIAATTNPLPHVLTRIDEEGREVIRWNWAKKEVSQKAYEGYYSKNPTGSYYKLGNSYDMVVVAFKQPLMSDGSRPAELDWVNETEAAKLDRQEAARFPGNH